MELEDQLITKEVDVNFQKANQQLGELQLSYGNIAANSVTCAAVISRLKDLIDLVSMLRQ